MDGFRESKLFEQLFEQIVRQCVEVGLVQGQDLSVDGSFVEANAAKESRIPREQLGEAAQVHHTVRQYLRDYFRLEDQVPETHLLRLIDRHISFELVREQLKDSYASPRQVHAEFLHQLALAAEKSASERAWCPIMTSRPPKIEIQCNMKKNYHAFAKSHLLTLVTFSTPRGFITHHHHSDPRECARAMTLIFDNRRFTD